MYEVKTYYSASNTSSGTDVMYKVKPYYGDKDEEKVVEELSVADIERKQIAVLQRLEQMTVEVDELVKRCDEKSEGSCHMSLGPLGTTCDNQLPNTGVPHDLVIHANPSLPPLSVVVLYQLLCQQYKVLGISHVHSSVSTIDNIEKVDIGKLRSVFGTTVNRDRTNYQLAITIIWTAETNECSLMVNPRLQTMIEGEANVARYLSRLLSPQYDSCDPITATEIDTLIDSSLAIKNGSSKLKASVIKSINVRLGKTTCLTGDVVTLADIIFWSALQQSGDADKQTGNVKKWIEKCSQNALFRSATAALL